MTVFELRNSAIVSSLSTVLQLFVSGRLSLVICLILILPLFYFFFSRVKTLGNFLFGFVVYEILEQFAFCF